MKAIKTLISSAALVAALTVSSSVMAVKPSERATLVDVAIAVNTSGPYQGAFDTLIAVLLGDAAYDMDGSLLKRLSGNGQYTVFAPTDGAFDALFDLAACNGVDLTPDLVRAVLNYHVAKGRRDAEDVLSSTQLRTLLGERFWQDSDMLYDIAGQEIGFVVNDVPADNGIIHAIDTVLLPVEIDLDCED